MEERKFYLVKDVGLVGGLRKKFGLADVIMIILNCYHIEFVPNMGALIFIIIQHHLTINLGYRLYFYFSFSMHH